MLQHPQSRLNQSNYQFVFKFYIKIVDVSENWTRIFAVEVENADHLTTTTAQYTMNLLLLLKESIIIEPIANFERDFCWLKLSISYCIGRNTYTKHSIWALV